MSSTESQQKFGFKFGRNGASARTMMLAEITELFHGRGVEATLAQYQEDIERFNVLHKPTEKARKLTWRHLIDLYGMDITIPLFRTFRSLWERDESARPMLACQMALARDPLLQLSQDKILSLAPGQWLPREEMEQALDEHCPDRYSKAMLKSLAQNVNGTWTNAGFLQGRSKSTVPSQMCVRSTLCLPCSSVICRSNRQPAIHLRVDPRTRLSPRTAAGVGSSG